MLLSSTKLTVHTIRNTPRSQVYKLHDVVYSTCIIQCTGVLKNTKFNLIVVTTNFKSSTLRTTTALKTDLALEKTGVWLTQLT